MADSETQNEQAPQEEPQAEAPQPEQTPDAAAVERVNIEGAPEAAGDVVALEDDAAEGAPGDDGPAEPPQDGDAASADAETIDASPAVADDADVTHAGDEVASADGDVDAATDGVESVAAAGDAGPDEGRSDVDEIEPVDEASLKKSSAEVKAIVEALIFASPDPLTPKALLKLLDSEPKEDVLAALEELKQDYERPGGLQLVEVAGGFQIVTRPDLHEWVRRLFHERSTQKLSAQALESLAVIAYRQPITAAEVTEIRGVSASGVLNTLLERHLIKIVGRKQVVGRPFMYATTKEFLIRFGLKDLSDLPRVEDMAESLGIESNLLIERAPTEEQLPLTEPELDREVDGRGFDEIVEEARLEESEPEPSEDDDPGPALN